MRRAGLSEAFSGGVFPLAGDVQSRVTVFHLLKAAVNYPNVLQTTQLSDPQPFGGDEKRFRVLTLFSLSKNSEIVNCTDLQR